MTKKRFYAKRRELVNKVIAYAEKRGDMKSVKAMRKSLYRMPRPEFDVYKSYDEMYSFLCRSLKMFN